MTISPFDERFQGFWVASRERSGENDAFPLFDGHFKIARHEEIFRFSVTTFALFGIVESAVPVGAVHIVGLWRVHLHKEVGISLIEFHADALFHWFCVRIGATVFRASIVAQSGKPNKGAVGVWWASALRGGCSG